MKFLFLFFRYSGITLFIREIFQRKKVTILLYHDISPENAQRHFTYLKSRYNLISLSDFIGAHQQKRVDQLPPKSLIITLDDGHKGNYRLLPLLKEMKIPITIFLCSEIIATQRHFWFKHPVSGTSIRRLKKYQNAERLEALRAEGFEQDKEFGERQALSAREIREMADYVDFQSHGCFHPCLPFCKDSESQFEIQSSKNKLEQMFQFHIHSFSFPNGDYGDRELVNLQKAGYSAGITCDMWFNDQKTDLYRLRRLDCRDDATLSELESKVTGIFIFLKRLIFGQDFGYHKK